MHNLSHTEENYLKAIFKISERSGSTASTNAIARLLHTSAASVTDMIKRLSEKDLINYEKYKGVTLTPEGSDIAKLLIRKHRLWEVFLVEKLHFSWDKVHDIAEQLEHIRSKELIGRLEEYLGFPKFDPHGDPIPDAEGNFTFRKQLLLHELAPGDTGVIVGVQDHAPDFLQYLDHSKLVLGAEVTVLEHFSYDESMRILINGATEQALSKKVSQNIFVQKK